YCVHRGQGGQSDPGALLDRQGGRHRAHQGARQRSGDEGHYGQRGGPCRHQHRSAPADDQRDGGPADLEDPDGEGRPAGGSRRAGGVARVRRVLVLDRIRVRPLGRAGHLLVTTLYVASPLGFSEAGRFFSRERLLPLLTRLGFEILDPWAITDPAAIERVRSLPDGEERRQAWQQLNAEIGATNQRVIERAGGVVAVLE